MHHEVLVSYDLLGDLGVSSCFHSKDQRDLERGHETGESGNDCEGDVGIYNVSNILTRIWRRSLLFVELLLQGCTVLSWNYLTGLGDVHLD